MSSWASKSLAEKLAPSVVWLRWRLRNVETLPAEDQNAFLTRAEALLKRRER